MIIPIVTLDKIFAIPDNKNIFFLDCTRINNYDSLTSRKGVNIDNQITDISNKINGNKIILLDDVIFSGNALREVISKFNKQGITVIKIISSICTKNAYDAFKKEVKYGVSTNYLLENEIDQICERDFYFGVAGSGIMVQSNNGLYKAPYFKPFVSPNQRASIPFEYENSFSIGCLDRNIYLWRELEKIKEDKIYVCELPEKIIYTDKDEEVVKTLKRKREILCK